MLNPAQLRPLLNALYGLVIMVSLMLLLMLTMVWVMPIQPEAGTVAQANGAPTTVRVAAKTLSADAQVGKDLFSNNCSACHSAGADRLVGPGLKGVRQRTPGEAWLQKWIRNSSAMVASGDPYAVKIYNEYAKTQMTSFPSLTDQHIKQILDYIDATN